MYKEQLTFFRAPNLLIITPASTNPILSFYLFATGNKSLINKATDRKKNWDPLSFICMCQSFFHVSSCNYSASCLPAFYV
ncbi:hypothetical protein NC652_040024 [Populus alba x Populus x berolinensis]|nr:hypothetical protein NC652_040024 [Populus alba x Populus x berolinensis]